MPAALKFLADVFELLRRAGPHGGGSAVPEPGAGRRGAGPSTTLQPCSIPVN